ncbi:MAG: hypothetical protein EXR59_01080 [Dehalococcoidia bacterium]|nr:hypothetical protein [Dehalococcoidia bacterium]
MYSLPSGPKVITARPSNLSGSASAVNPLWSVRPELASFTRSAGLSGPGAELATGGGDGVAVGGNGVDVGVETEVGIVVAGVTVGVTPDTAVADGESGVLVEGTSSELQAADRNKQANEIM